MATESPTDFSRSELETLLRSVDALDERELAEIEVMLEELERRAALQAAKDDLIAFCKRMDPNYKVGRHHRKLADQLMALESGAKDRVCVNMPPRHGKSQLVSIYYPAWFIGRNPTKKVMMVSHTTDLAVDFGRKVRNLIDTPQYAEIFPTVALATDSKSAGRWNTNMGGEYFACGVGSALAGRGADLLLCARNDMPIPTARGTVRADEVRHGDMLLTHKGFYPVSRIAGTMHLVEVDVDGAVLSENHPVWTFNKGWVVAGQLTTCDLVYTMNLLQHMGVQLGRLAHNTRAVLRTCLQYLGNDAAALQQPKCSKLHELWRKGHKLLSGVGKLCEVLRGHGRSTFAEAHIGQGGRGWPVLSGELSLGRRGDATEQQKERTQDNRVRADSFCGTVGSQDWAEPNSGSPQGVQNGYDSGRSVQDRAYELGSAPRTPKECGWVRHTVFRLYSRCSKSNRRAARILVGALENAFKSPFWGLLLGIRRLRLVTLRQTKPGAYFIDFTVPGANTFFVGQLMTHNCDDPHSEQDILNGNMSSFTKAYEWFTFGARTRLMPGGRVAIVQTRWSDLDLTGRLVQDMVNNEGSDQYEVIELPAILDVENKETGEITQKALWPEFFDLPALLRTKASMPAFQWNAQYQQRPTGEEAAIIKREWWRLWPEDDPPHIEYIIMSLDAAAETNNRADYTALTTWGVFFNEEEANHQIILLNSIKRRLEFPELKQLCLDEYKHWEPDSFIVEKKSAGTAIFQELRRMGLPVAEYTPHRGTGDKMARLNSVSDIIASGMVWVPPKRWAEELVEEVAGFPFASNDDLVDSTVMAMLRFRQGGFIRLPTDEPDEPLPYRGRVEYY